MGLLDFDKRTKTRLMDHNDINVMTLAAKIQRSSAR